MSEKLEKAEEKTPARTSPNCTITGVKNNRIMTWIGMGILTALIITTIILLILDKMEDTATVVILLITYVAGALLAWFANAYVTKCQDKVTMPTEMA